MENSNGITVIIYAWKLNISYNNYLKDFKANNIPCPH